jgi:transposase-like protein
LPHCGETDAFDCRRWKGAPRFRCRACAKDFLDYLKQKPSVDFSGYWQRHEQKETA